MYKRKYKKAKYTSQDIFYWFISRSYYQSTSSTVYDTEMFSYNKIILLLYFAQGVYLNKHKRSLFKGKITEEKYIPIIEGIAEKYKNIYTFQDYENVRNNDTDWYNWVRNKSEKQSEKLDKFLEEIYWNFGQYDTWMLIKMYQDGKPVLRKEIRKKDLKKKCKKYCKYFN